MSDLPLPESELPQPGYPKVEWIEGDYLARWTFASGAATRVRPMVRLVERSAETVEGNVWIIRSSMNAP